MGLLFHPDVNDHDIDNLIADISQSRICKRYNPKFQRLTENPNQHVTLRVVEITFDHKWIQTQIINGDHIDVEHKNSHHEEEDILYGNVSSQHLKSLDEIEFDEEEEDDLMNNDDDDSLSQIGLDERRPIKRQKNHNLNTNDNNNNHNKINTKAPDSNDDNTSMDNVSNTSNMSTDCDHNIELHQNQENVSNK